MKTLTLLFSLVALLISGLILLKLEETNSRLLHYAAHSSESPSPNGKGDSSHRALELSRQAFKKGDRELGHDFLLNAIRTAPSDPIVFEQVAWQIERLIESPAYKTDDNAQDQAIDLLKRLDAMLAYLPVDEVRDSRERLSLVNRLWESATYDESLQSSATDGIFDGVPDSKSETAPLEDLELESLLTLAENQTTPASARILLLSQARSELTNQLLDNATSLILNADEGSPFWDRWQSTATRVDLAEAVALLSDYKTNVLPGYARWEKEVRGFTWNIQKPSNVLAVKDLVALTEKTKGHLRTGIRWEQEIRGYKDFALDPLTASDVRQVFAVEDFPSPEKEIERLNWTYSHKAALAWINFIQDESLVETEGWLWWKEKDPSKQEAASDTIPLIFGGIDDSEDQIANEILSEVQKYIRIQSHSNSERRANSTLKLLLLLAIEPMLLNRYVRERFETAWKQNTENLDDDGRLLAAKLRIWKGI